MNLATKKPLIIAIALTLAIVVAAISVVFTQAGPHTSPTSSSSTTPAAAKSVTTLIDVLPYSTDDYSINYTANTDGSVDIFVHPISQYDDSSPIARTAELRTHKQAALKYIEQYGGDLSQLNIIVDPDPDNESD